MKMLFFILLTTVFILAGSQSCSDEVLKKFAATLAGTYKPANSTNDEHTVVVSYADLPLVAQRNSISLIFMEYNGSIRIRVSYRSLSNAQGKIKVKPYNFTNEFLERNDELTQEVLRTVTCSDLMEINPKCIRTFEDFGCYYSGKYHACTRNDVEPPIFDAEITCTQSTIWAHKDNTIVSNVFEKIHKACPPINLKPTEDVCTEDLSSS